MNSARGLSILMFAILIGALPVHLKAQSQPDELIGPVTKQQLLESDRVFEIYIDRYQPEEEAVEYLQALRDTVSLYMFVGNWCRETKKYIPGLMKTLELAGNPFIETHYIGVDRPKKFPKEFLKKFNIKYIPTVLVFKDNAEVGRIEEKPSGPIELDLIQVLKVGIKKMRQ